MNRRIVLTNDELRRSVGFEAEQTFIKYIKRAEGWSVFAHLSADNPYHEFDVLMKDSMGSKIYVDVKSVHRPTFINFTLDQVQYKLSFMNEQPDDVRFGVAGILHAPPTPELRFFDIEGWFNSHEPSRQKIHWSDAEHMCFIESWDVVKLRGLAELLAKARRREASRTYDLFDD